MAARKIVYFTTLSGSTYKLLSTVSEKMLWSEYSDEMLEEIKKYWHGNIINEEQYIRWKAKKESKKNQKTKNT